MSFKKPEYCSVLGVHVTVGDMNSIKECVLNNIEELRGKYICVANVHTTVTAYENRSYRRVQNGAAMVFPDGGPLSIVCRLMGHKNASRVTGPDFMGEMFKEKGVRQKKAVISSLSTALANPCPHSMKMRAHSFRRIYCHLTYMRQL